MQTGLQFFDMPIKGAGPEQTQKIAIKTSEPSAEKLITDDGFMSIMETLMALSPEQLETSLKQLEWIPIEEGVDAFAPLIDLSQINRCSDSTHRSESVIALLENSDKSEASVLPSGQAKKMTPQTAFAGTAPLSMGEGRQLAGNENNRSFVPPHLETVKNTPMSFPSEIQSVSHVGTETQAVDKQMRNATSLTETKVASSGRESMQNVISANETVKRMPTVGPSDTKATNKTGPSSFETIKPAAEGMASDAFSKLDTEPAAPQNVVPLKKQALPSGRHIQNVSVEKEDQTFAESNPGKNSLNEKPVMRMQAEQFRAVSERLASGHDKGITAINQMNETALKEAVRHNVKSASPQMERGNAEVKTDQVQPNGSAKDASLSFSSRWNAVLEKSVDMATEAKPMDAAPDRTEQHDVIRQIVQRMTLKSNRLQSQMNIKLKPEFLGNIRMQISSDNQQIVVRMVADSSTVKEMIEQNIQYLRAELQHHGLEIDKFDVSVGSDKDEWRQEQQAQLRERSRQKGEASSQNSDRQNNAEDKPSKEQHRAKHSSILESEIDYFV